LVRFWTSKNEHKEKLFIEKNRGQGLELKAESEKQVLGIRCQLLKTYSWSLKPDTWHLKPDT